MLTIVEPRGTAQPAVGDPVLTVQEVAEYLKVTTKTVYELIRQGQLPSFRIGRAVRCRRSAIEAFIEERLEQSSRQPERAHPQEGDA